MTSPLQTPSDADRRRSVRRTAWTIAAIAVLIYGGFILSGVLGK